MLFSFLAACDALKWSQLLLGSVSSWRTGWLWVCAPVPPCATAQQQLQSSLCDGRNARPPASERGSAWRAPSNMLLYSWPLQPADKPMTYRVKTNSRSTPLSYLGWHYYCEEVPARDVIMLFCSIIRSAIEGWVKEGYGIFVLHTELNRDY